MQKSSPKKYIRAKIKEKKIKVSYFLTPMGFLDQFHLIGTIYAQSGGGDGGYGGGGATSNTAGGSTGGAGTGSSTGGTSGTNSGTGGN